MEYVSNLSGGKDSLCQTLKLMELGKPLTKAVMYDTGMEFKTVYRSIERMKPILADYGAELVILKPERDFWTDMLISPICKRDGTEAYGSDWCGGCVRWATRKKIDTINTYTSTLGEYVQYIGIAADEPKRIKKENNKVYPLVEWGMTEKDCLEYCYSKGFDWKENGVELYEILDRVSCWCCKNKNLKELRNIYHYLPEYWGMLKGLQSRIDRPFRSSGETIFDLERRFQMEDAQMVLKFD